MQTDSPFLVGHTNINNAYEVKDYPYGFRLRTSIFYWIESKEGKGDRLCSYTINPKNGRKNAVKCSTYSAFMYMYINEDGHVKRESIDAYEPEKFTFRFNFILNKIGEMWINDIQKKSLRSTLYGHIRGNAPYQIVKYSEGKKEAFKQWVKDTLTHIVKCEFKDLVSYPEPPEQDNEAGEVKMTITEYNMY